MMRPISFRLLPVLLVAFAAAGCGDDPVRESGVVEGLWRVQGEGADVVMRIDEGRIEMYVQDTIADCYERTVYDIRDVDGIRFRLASQADTSTAFTVEMRREDDVLHVTAFGEDDTYAPTALDPSTLPLCQRPQPTAVCAELPAIAVGDTVEAALEATDPRNPDGSRFDLYRLPIDATTDVQIAMESTEVDSWLAVYDSAGAFLQENDDASNLTVDAELAASLEPGCHILMAASANADELGIYELSVELP